MKLDTSSYYPKSHLDDDDAGNGYMPHAGNEASVSSEQSAEPSRRPAGGEVPAPAPESTPDLPPTEAEAVVTRFSNILSWVLVPILMPVYASILAFNLSVLSFTGVGTRIVFTLIVMAFNMAVPAVLILLLKKLGIVRDVGLNNRDERFIPYLICIACLIGTALFMAYKGAPAWFVMFFFGGAAAGIVEVVINRWWKISVHAAGIAGIVAMLVHLMIFDYTMPGIQTWLVISLVLAGLLGSARVWLGRHTVWQVLAGYAVGFAAVYLMMLVNKV